MATWVAPNDNGNWTTTEARRTNTASAATIRSRRTPTTSPTSSTAATATISFIGQSYNDDLYGGNNADYLYGDYGNDNLSGGLGQELVRLRHDAEQEPQRRLSRRLPVRQRRRSDPAQQVDLQGRGQRGQFLQSKKFEVSDNATKSKTRILYNEDKGVALLHPGRRRGNKVKFVNVNGVNLDNDDFYIIA